VSRIGHAGGIKVVKVGPPNLRGKLNTRTPQWIQEGRLKNHTNLRIEETSATMKKGMELRPKMPGEGGCKVSPGQGKKDPA